VAFLTVVTGPPGAGKSTVAAALAANFDSSVLVVGDAFFAFLARDAIEPWLPESHQQNDVVISAAAAATGAFVAGGYTTIYDGVLGPWFLDAFLQRTGLDSLNYVLLLPSEDECVRRVATRRGHGFTDELATRKMHREFATAPLPARHMIVTDDQGVDEAVDMAIDRLRRDQLRYDRETAS
jgi:cytidylate kinase